MIRLIAKIARLLEWGYTGSEVRRSLECKKRWVRFVRWHHEFMTSREMAARLK